MRTSSSDAANALDVEGLARQVAIEVSHDTPDRKRALDRMLRPADEHGIRGELERTLIEHPAVLAAYVGAARDGALSFHDWALSCDGGKLLAPIAKVAHAAWLERERVARAKARREFLRPSESHTSKRGIVTVASLDAYEPGEAGFTSMREGARFAALNRRDVERIEAGDVDCGHRSLVLEAMRWFTRSEPFLFLCGGTGAGKTFGALAVASNVPDRRGRGVYAIASCDIAGLLRMERSRGRPQGRPNWGRGAWELLMEARLLVVDELFATTSDTRRIDEEREAMRELANVRRDERHRTIVTTNRTMADLLDAREVCSLDEATASRLSGFTHVAGAGLEDRRRGPEFPRVGRDVLHETFVATHPFVSPWTKARSA